MYLSLIKDKERSHKMWSYGNFWPPVFDCTVQLRIVKIVQKYDKIGPKLQYPIPIKSPFSVWQRLYLPLMFIFQFYRNSKSLFDFYHLKRAGRGILMNPSSPLRWKPTPNLDSKFCGYWSFWNFSPLWRPRPCLEFHSDVSFLWTSSLHVEHLKKLEESILLLLKKMLSLGMLSSLETTPESLLFSQVDGCSIKEIHRELLRSQIKIFKVHISSWAVFLRNS